MDAQGARNLSKNSVSKEIDFINSEIKKACEKGHTDCCINYLSQGCRAYLEDLNYKIELLNTTTMNYYKISW